MLSLTACPDNSGKSHKAGKRFIVIPLFLLLLICCTEEYKLSVDVTGNGAYKVSPEKSNYEEGETVTIIALPDSGWLFYKWLGSVSTNYNPLFLTMDGDKYMELVFSVPFEPSMSGDWDGIQLPLTFHIQQALFDSSLTGTLVGPSPNGGNLEFAVTGYNRVSVIVLNCKKPGYYDILYTGWWVNNTRLDGGFTEAGIYYNCDLLKFNDAPIACNRNQFFHKKISESK